MSEKGLGRRINSVRKARGFTAERLAEVCNINPVYLRQIEGGKKMPSLPVFIDICNALHISPDYLLRDDLCDNEISDIREIEKYWENASAETLEVVTAMIKAVMELKL